MRLSAFLPAVLTAVIGCGGSTDEPAATEAPDPFAGWETLISADWSVQGGLEGYVCARRTMPEDVFVAGFAATALGGSHHAALTLGVPDAPDGVGPCGFDSVFPISAFSSAAKTAPLKFPPGIATKIPGGSQLLLNIHLSNSSDRDQSGNYEIRVLTIAESEVVERAEQFAVGAQGVEIPARATTTHTAHCTIRNDMTLVAVAPHMHALGKHEKVFAETGSGELTLFDAPFTFGDQSYSVLDSVKMGNGDRLRVECTHENPTDNPVTEGPTIANEMCMATFYRYPIGGLGFCADN
jgi:hypothetical protein